MPPKTLSQLGWKAATKESVATERAKNKPRSIISVDGMDKSGKTHFCLTAPGPIVYQDVDIGSEGMIEKFIEAGKVIYPRTYSFLKDVRKTKEHTKIAALPVWQRFVDDYYAALEASLTPDGPRTIVWDNGADIWSLCLLAHLGKDIQIQPTERTQANSTFKELVKAAFEYHANLLIIHQLMPEFDNPRKLERKGAFNKMAYLIQAAVQTTKKKTKNDDGEDVSTFEYKITTCRSNTNLEGEVFEGGSPDEPGADFATIAMALNPGTKLKDWK